MKRSFELLRENATHPENIQFMVAVDNDDKETIQQLSTLGDVTVTYAEYGGYHAIFERFNQMLPLSVGEFILIWSDDQMCYTKGWDDIVAPYKGNVCTIFTRDENAMFVHRAIYNAWGKVSVYYCTDIIAKVLGCELGIYTRRDELNVVHSPAPVIPHTKTEQISSEGWFKYRDEIYRFTDEFGKHIPRLFPAAEPLHKHPINDFARGKIYWGFSGMPPCVG